MMAMRRLADPEGVASVLEAEQLSFGVDLHLTGLRFEARSTSGTTPDYLKRVYRAFVDSAADRPGKRRLFVVAPDTPAHGRFAALLGARPRPRGHLLVIDWFPWVLELATEALVNYYASKLIRLAAVQMLAGDHVTLHAASLYRDGVGILLVGEAAAGKTTLALRLLDRGFLYCADDTTPIRRRDLACVPFPTPFLVRADERTGLPPWPELAGRAPEIAILDEPRWFVERWDRVAPLFRPTHVLFLDSAPAAGPELEDVATAHAALELVRNTVFPLGCDLESFDLSELLLDTYAQLTAGARCCKLSTHDLDAALARILAFAGAPQPGATS